MSVPRAIPPFEMTITETVNHAWNRPEAWFLACAAERGLLHHARSTEFKVLDDALTTFAGEGDLLTGTWYVADVNGVEAVSEPSFVITQRTAGEGELLVGLLTVRTTGTASACVAATDEQGARREVERLQRALGQPSEEQGLCVDASFWVDGKHGAHSYARKIAVRELDEVLTGVSGGAAQQVRELAVHTPPAGGVHVWHGPPGCGKSTIIRSLAAAWEEHVTLDVVIDPEKLLADATYLLGVLNASRLGRTGNKRRMIVLEDSGELVSIDARTRIGHGLSRLLNLTDGMFGHDETPLVVITTNEPVGKIHPAILRSGRCRSVIEFGPLSMDEARSWAKHHGLDPAHVTRSMTIAELSALVDGSAPIGAPGMPNETFGFSVVPAEPE